MAVADPTVETSPGAGAQDAPAPGLVVDPLVVDPLVVDPLVVGLPSVVDVAVIGAGCSGTATAVRLAAAPGERQVVVFEGRAADDSRSWCSWDDGSDPLPEARSASWDRWEVRTDQGTSTGTDPEHPYVLVRAADRRAAAEERLRATDAVRVVRGAPVTAVSAAGDEVAVRSPAGTVRASAVLDARGPRCPEHVPTGRVLLHQRFVGQWITTAAPVFDTTTVTLMDFSGRGQGREQGRERGRGQVRDGHVRFVYVLPVTATRALVESTLFTADEDDPFDHRRAIDAYVRERWQLDSWTVDEEESGCIPMTDAPAASLLPPLGGRPASALRTEAVSGTTRPSTGYGFARSNRHSATVAACLADGSPVPPLRDRARTRVLDAVFLRFLRDRPDRAPEVFRRLFALPGPVVVRFLTERSSVADDLRIVLALPKPPFLAALARTILERSRPLVRRTRGVAP